MMRASRKRAPRAAAAQRHHRHQHASQRLRTRPPAPATSTLPACGASAVGQPRQRRPPHLLAGALVGDVELVLVAAGDLGAADVEAQRLEAGHLRATHAHAKAGGVAPCPARCCTPAPAEPLACTAAAGAPRPALVPFKACPAAQSQSDAASHQPCACTHGVQQLAQDVPKLDRHDRGKRVGLVVNLDHRLRHRRRGRAVGRLRRRGPAGVQRRVGAPRVRASRGVRAHGPGGRQAAGGRRRRRRRRREPCGAAPMHSCLLEASRVARCTQTG